MMIKLCRVKMGLPRPLLLTEAVAKYSHSIKAYMDMSSQKPVSPRCQSISCLILSYGGAC